jgi:hypothetical protein
LTRAEETAVTRRPNQPPKSSRRRIFIVKGLV